MPYLVDSNILLRIAQPTHAMHGSAKTAAVKLFTSGQRLVILRQNVREFWNVCTRPSERNGLGFDHRHTEIEVQKLEATFTVLDDGPAIYKEWRRLVLAHSVTGVQVHDCYLAAAMKVHGLTHILTFNTTDFKRYPHVTAVDPNSIR